MVLRHLVPEWIRTLTPYPPGKPIEEVEREFGISGSVKLASNENPLGPSPRAVVAVAEALRALHPYPRRVRGLPPAPARRRGDKRAIVAVAHSILVIAYQVPGDGQSYRELGGDYFDQMSTARLTRYHTRRLAALGYAVTLTPRAA